MLRTLLNSLQRNALVVFMVIFACNANAQFYSTGEDPSGIKWSQLKSKNFRIVYESGNDRLALKYMKELEVAAQKLSYSLRSNPNRIDVLLHNRSVLANALVSWAPSRMEFYIRPPADTYAQDWPSQLALHEYRHVLQSASLNKGFTRYLGYALGEQAVGAVLGLYVPRWFLEGDAVYSETVFSGSGRGRDPMFSMPVRAQLLTYGAFSYDKAYFGSYKTFVPDHYVLGYHLVSYVRSQFGIMAWDKALTYVARNPYHPFAFSKGLQNATGFGKLALYKRAMRQLQWDWKNESSQPSDTVIETRKSAPFISYIKIHNLHHSKYFAVKQIYGELDQFVIMEEGKNDSVLFSPGPYDPLSVQLCGNTVVFTAYKTDLRWDNQSFAEVHLLDINSGKIKVVQPKTRWFSPVLSPDNQYLAYVDCDTRAMVALRVLNLHTGINEFSLVDSLFGSFSMLRWDVRSLCLVAVHTNHLGKAVVKVDVNQKASGKLIPYSYNEIYDPLLLGDTLIYVSGCAAKPELFAYLPLQNRHFQLTNTSFGAAFPSLVRAATELVFSEYTANGFKFKKKLLADMLWVQADSCNTNARKQLEGLVRAETNHPPIAIDTSSLSVEPYNKFEHLFRIHSYGPFAINSSNTDVNPGFTLMSHNLLSTSFTTLGYEYDLEAKEGRFFANYSYRGFYPVIDFEVEYRDREGLFRVEDDVLRMKWYEGSFRTSINLPLSWVSGNWNRYVIPQFTLRGAKRQEHDNQPASFSHHDWITFGGDVLLANYLRTGVRNMYPKFGQAIQFGYQAASISGTQFSAEALIFLPGFMRHHGLKLYAGYEYQNDGELSFSRSVSMPRGHSVIHDTEIWSTNFTYKLPLMYPDYSLGPFAYIKRVKMALFADLAFNNFNSYTSCGFELTSDMHLFRFVAPVDMGFRTSYIPDTNNWSINFLLYVNFSQL